MRRFRPICLFLSLGLSVLGAQEGLVLSLGAGGGTEISLAQDSGSAGQGLSGQLDTSMSYRAGDYGSEFTNTGFAPTAKGILSLITRDTQILMAMSTSTDGKYGAALADIAGGSAGSFYFLLDQGGIRQKLGALSLEAGRFKVYDEVRSPYSLFLNSLGHSSITMSLAYDDGRFFYKSRWLGLNHDSSAGSTAISTDWSTGFPERGASIKTYGLTLGEHRIGFQDVAIYSGRWFDYEYFLSPLPMYFTQYARGTGGVPWVTNYDDNSIMGFFWEWTRPDVGYACFQFLLDDFGLGDFISTSPKNPWQIALSAGGRYQHPLGSLGFYVAMATKYTFEPSNGSKAIDAYGYSYYPETRFTSYWQDAAAEVTRDISIEDNEIGYKYGENNLAVQVDWRGTARGFDLGAAFEFRLAGSNAPANPGQNYAAVPSDGTKWLDDSVLEKRFLLSLAMARKVSSLRIYGILTAGMAFDAMDLVAPTSSYTGFGNGTYIYTPQAGNTEYILSLCLGLTMSLGYPGQ